MDWLIEGGTTLLLCWDEELQLCQGALACSIEGRQGDGKQQNQTRNKNTRNQEKP